MIYFDTETTGDVNPHLVQLFIYNTNSGSIKGLFKPQSPISIMAMSVHGITNLAVQDKETFQESEGYQMVKDIMESSVCVAHNAKYDVEVMAREGITITRYIDTLKLSRRLRPDLENHKLQYLRYWMGEDQVEEGEGHDAETDVKVLIRLCNKIQVESGRSIEEMIDYTNKPIKLKYFTFGKHKGKEIYHVKMSDPKYITWLLGQMEDKDESDDLYYTLKNI